MTNKLPEIGKRYKRKALGCDYEIVVENILDNRNIVCAIVPDGKVKWNRFTYQPHYFWDDYKELPEDNYNQSVSSLHNDNNSLHNNNNSLHNGGNSSVNTAKQNDSCFSLEAESEINEVEKARESLLMEAREASNPWSLLRVIAKFNALDNIKTQTEPVIDNKIETKLPWKDAYNKAWTQGWNQAMRAKREENAETEKAKEELRKVINFSGPTTMEIQYSKYVNASKKLLNALDNIKTQAKPVADNETEVNVSVDLGKEGGDMTCEVYWKDREDGIREIIDIKYKEPKKEAKLPWKDVSELPRDHLRKHNEELIGLKVVFGGKASFATHIDILKHGKGITLTDLINSIESMLSRQDELEERVRKLEGK